MSDMAGKVARVGSSGAAGREHIDVAEIEATLRGAVESTMERMG